MKNGRCQPALLIAICIFGLVPQAFICAQSEAKDLFLFNEYQTGDSGFFAGVFGRYQEKHVPLLVLENSPRIENLMNDGKLELTLADALTLALENNLDIAVQRYIPEYSQTDLLRSKAGQSPRGFTGGTTPGGLTAGALGAGLGGAGAGAGVGSAGGITGG